MRGSGGSIDGAGNSPISRAGIENRRAPDPVVVDTGDDQVDERGAEHEGCEVLQDLVCAGCGFAGFGEDGEAVEVGGLHVCFCFSSYGLGAVGGDQSEFEARGSGCSRFATEEICMFECRGFGAWGLGLGFSEGV